MALACFKTRTFLTLLFVASGLVVASLLVFNRGIAYKRSVLVIEPEEGPRKLRYSEQKSPATDNRSQVLYNSLRGKAYWEVKALSKTKILSKSETPILGIRAGSKPEQNRSGKARTKANLEVRFEEKESQYRSAPSKVYRVKVAPVRDLEEALKIWSVVKSKNPLFFSKFDSLLDKVFLPDGKVVHYLSMGDYKDFKLACLVSKKLEAAGYSALIYELSH